jgi:hypothetical protein
VSALCLVVAVGACFACLVGLRYDGGGAAHPFTTVRGQVVQIHGRGLYRHDSVFIGAAYRAQDLVTLVVGVPLLLLATWRRRSGALRASLLSLGIIAYFLYLYLSMALAAAYNPLFLLYVALFSASFFALVVAMTSPDLRRLTTPEALAGAPRRGPALYLLVAGAVTLVVWLAPVVSALLGGQPPALLDHYTTYAEHEIMWSRSRTSQASTEGTAGLAGHNSERRAF